MNTFKKTTGAALALAVATLAGCNSMGGDKMGMEADKMSAKADSVHCFGVNKCKGHNDCKTATNACKGKASCKGKGYLKMASNTCGEVGGKEG